MSIIDFSQWPGLQSINQHIEPNRDFPAALQAHGYYVPNVTPCVTITRFATQQDKSGEKSGWYKWDNGKYPIAFFGDWRSGESYEWRGYETSKLCAHELKEANELYESRIKEKDAQIEIDREACRQTVGQIWAEAESADGHEYLTRKKLPSLGLRKYHGSLIVPVYDHSSMMVGLQKIDPDGSKKFEKGTPKKGNFYIIQGSGATIGICEGWATGASVHIATGMTVYVAFDAGNLQHVAQYLKTTYPKARIINFADDDQWKERNTGRETARKLKELFSIESVFPIFADCKDHPTDWNDLLVLEGKEAVKTQIEKALSPVSKFNILSASDILNMNATQWRIHEILPAQGIAAIFGPPGTGKTFLALDLAFRIAGGLPWFGHETYQAPIFYINQESGWGLKKRLLAWRDGLNQKIPEDVHFILDPIHIVPDAEELARIAPKNSVVIIDTLNSVSSGLDENSAKDMGLIIEAAQEIRRKTHSLVILIHHTGKDTDKGARGHSSLKGALDAEIQIVRAGKDRKWTLTKSKESLDGISGAFDLQNVILGQDSYCKVISSCYVREVADEPASIRTKLTSNEMLGLEALKEAAKESGSQWVELEAWRTLFYKVSTADNQSAKKVAFQRIRKSLQEKEIIDVDEDMYKILDVTNGTDGT